MSGGQQQMLVIGRALMTRPRALMLDEPSLGLAPLAVEGIFTALRELNRSGVAVLLIEQNAMAALRLADRAYVLQNGRVVREGSGAELASDRALIEHYVGGAT
jgi:branched-chain amino acid transport system ATP-binding protein